MPTTFYKQPKSVPVPKCNGYPSTDVERPTGKIRGCGAATKGTMFQNDDPEPSKLKGPINVLGR